MLWNGFNIYEINIQYIFDQLILTKLIFPINPNNGEKLKIHLLNFAMYVQLVSNVDFSS